MPDLFRKQTNCTGRELGFFTSDYNIDSVAAAKAEIEAALDDDPGMLIHATTSPSQKKSAKALLELGFVEVGHYNGHTGKIRFFVKGLELAPEAEKSSARIAKSRLKRGRKPVLGSLKALRAKARS